MIWSLLTPENIICPVRFYAKLFVCSEAAVLYGCDTTAPWSITFSKASNLPRNDFVLWLPQPLPAFPYIEGFSFQTFESETSLNGSWEQQHSTPWTNWPPAHLHLDDSLTMAGRAQWHQGRFRGPDFPLSLCWCIFRATDSNRCSAWQQDCWTQTNNPRKVSNRCRGFGRAGTCVRN